MRKINTKHFLVEDEGGKDDPGRSPKNMELEFRELACLLRNCLLSHSVAKTLSCFLEDNSGSPMEKWESFLPLSHLFDSNKGLIPSSCLFVLYVKLTREIGRICKPAAPSGREEYGYQHR